MKVRLDILSMSCGVALGLGFWAVEARWVKVSHAVEPQPVVVAPAPAPEGLTLRQLQDQVLELQQHLHDVENAVLEVAPARQSVAVELLRGSRVARRATR